ncbi:restriction endonuclease subunit S [Methanosarcina mazei]|uniref:Type I restriction modification DNA specificity domain-containing protein n=1 Tax=Methanosarcina mazei TaxID=2209 RepID=A0A0F8H6G4_METMZ|nr:restriction endonuclease subunit S [Methanosarcina mazei]KKG32541.1 hypothetical protein DU49_14550 [Methanosarcina mazei]KKG36039.1 hypothetical protein DU35_06980 [Methanosarcina mazei]KKG40135.1 hypothetical protein DU41_14635 [Methanosarcina mazei]KKG42382.1 hypothetical protein DU39_12710 [Methanosarcina mazei]KKG49538.1 hypothetical protein DU33_08565 [Methanosarcina mazei]
MNTITCKSRKLQNIITLKKGKPPAEQSYFGQDAELYLTPEYLRGKASSEPVKPSANAVRVMDGDTIVLWDGSNAGELFRARKGILASTMSLIEHEDTFDKEYFFYAVKNWESHLKAQTSGSGIPHVDKEVIGKLEIFQFAKSEQTKIAEILSTVDQAIEKTEALIAKQQRIKTGLMQDLLTRGIDEHGNLRSEETHKFKDSPLGRIPIEWEFETFENITPVDAPICYGIVQPGIYDYAGVKVAGIYTINSDFHQWHMSSKKVEQAYVRSRIITGDVLLSIKGTTGKVGVVPDGINGNISREIARIRPIEYINPYYLRFFMLSDFFQKYLNNAEVGTTRAEISIKILRGLYILIPPYTEQNLIVSRIMSIEQVIESSLKEFNKLRSLKTGLMQDLLTGKKRVTVLLNEKEVVGV